MREQRLQNRQPDALQGVFVVLGIALAAFAGSALFSRLAPLIGALSSVLFIAYGCAIAGFLLNWFAMSLVYTANDDCMRLCRAYGKRERFIADIWFNQVTAYGDPAEIKQRYPSARAIRATRRQCEFAPLALAYKTGGRTAVAVIQPDDAMREHVISSIRKHMK